MVYSNNIDVKVQFIDDNINVGELLIIIIRSCGLGEKNNGDNAA